MAYQIIYPPEQTTKTLPEGEPQPSSVYCAIETKMITMDEVPRTQYQLVEKKGGLSTRAAAEPFPLDMVKIRFSNVLFPERDITRPHPLEARLDVGLWACFEGNRGERESFRQLINEQIQLAYSPEFLEKFYGFRSFEVKEVNSRDPDLESLADSLLDNWRLKDKQALPKAEYLKTIFLINLDEDNFLGLSSQNYKKDIFWRSILFLTKLRARIVVIGPPGSFWLTYFTSGGILASMAPLMPDEGILISHELEKVEEKLTA